MVGGLNEPVGHKREGWGMNVVGEESKCNLAQLVRGQLSGRGRSNVIERNADPNADRLVHGDRYLKVWRWRSVLVSDRHFSEVPVDVLGISVWSRQVSALQVHSKRC